jgi:hypothetical protein
MTSYSVTIHPKVGDIVTYRPFGGGVRRVRVTGWEADVKNGRPGFDADLISSDPSDPDDDLGLAVWGYDDQILTIESEGVTIDVS